LLIYFLILSMKLKPFKLLNDKPLVLLIFLLIGSPLLVNAQLNSGIDGKNREDLNSQLIREKWNKEVGTFQVQIVNSRIKPQVQASIIDKILALRTQTERVYLPLMDNVRIMILPEEEIKRSDFKALELFKYLQE